jgi:hypothetical protein
VPPPLPLGAGRLLGRLQLGDDAGQALGERVMDLPGQSHRQMTLWTQDCLTAARRIYQAAGFRLTGEGKHHSFGHDLVEQTWSRSL